MFFTGYSEFPHHVSGHNLWQEKYHNAYFESMYLSYQYLGARWWFSTGSLSFPTTYNWLVTTCGRKSTTLPTFESMDLSTSNLELGSGFHRVLRVSLPLTTGWSQLVAEKVPHCLPLRAWTWVTSNLEWGSGFHRVRVSLPLTMAGHNLQQKKCHNVCLWEHGLELPASWS